MTRDSILEEVLGINSNAILLQMGTGTGKTRLAIEKTMSIDCKKVLVVAPKHAVLKGWKVEFATWGYEEFLPNVTFSTYNSLEKHSDVDWDMIIFDEAHHLSERCRDIFALMTTKNVMFLSATMTREIIRFINILYPNLYSYYIGMKKTIDEGILPDPEIILIPLKLDSNKVTCDIVKNPKGKTPGWICPYSKRWDYIRQKHTRVIIRCTQQEYYDDLCSQVDYYKRKGMYSEILKNKWLKIAGERLKWLARQKNQVVKTILNKLQNERTLTFCCDIEQSDYFGPNSINSKNKNALDILGQFNEGSIDHIQACNMLDEGVNLVDCRVGIFANINSSERIITQRNGRILRHPKPVIILPYFINTREEELVNKMMENYNPKLIKTVTSLLNFKL